MRRDYTGDPLHAADLDDDPIRQFGRWLTAAEQAGVPEPTAMALATVAGSQPSVRIVLLKDHSADGFVFFTNYHSRKGREITQAGRAALCFGWHAIHRQVRVQGPVQRVDGKASDEYFAGRPRGAQIAAAISDQSAPVASRAQLEEAFAALERELDGGPVARPARWGGFRVIPEQIEFWQGRRDRLHDRFLYVRNGTGWRRERLQP